MKTTFPKDKLNILLLENISSEAVNMFSQNGYTNVKQIKHALTEEELLNEIQDVHILGIRSKTQLTPTVFEKAKKLMAVGCFCIGVNQVELRTATRLGIAVFNAPFSNTRSVAELVIGAAIMLKRQIPEKNKLAHQGVWMKTASNAHELRGKILGIIGYGNIGSQLSILAEGMGMRVKYFDVQSKLPLGNTRSASSLEQLLADADVVSLHVPHNASTKDLINSGTITHFKPGAILINYSRGEVVDLEVVKKALLEKKLGGAAIDVYKNEPESNGQKFKCCLQNVENVLLTPHIGGSTEEAQINIGKDLSDKLIKFIENGQTTGSHSVPELALPVQSGNHRILHIHKNKPGILTKINKVLSDFKVNINAQYLNTNPEIGYVVLDADQMLKTETLDALKAVEDTIKLRSLY